MCLVRLGLRPVTGRTRIIERVFRDLLAVFLIGGLGVDRGSAHGARFVLVQSGRKGGSRSGKALSLKVLHVLGGRSTVVFCGSVSLAFPVTLTRQTLEFLRGLQRLLSAVMSVPDHPRVTRGSLQFRHDLFDRGTLVDGAVQFPSHHLLP